MTRALVSKLVAAVLARSKQREVSKEIIYLPQETEVPMPTKVMIEIWG